MNDQRETFIEDDIDTQNEIEVGGKLENSAILGVSVQLAQGWYSGSGVGSGRSLPVDQIVNDAKRLCDACQDMIVNEIRAEVRNSVDAEIAGTIQDESGAEIGVTQDQIDYAVEIDEGKSESSTSPESEASQSNTLDAPGVEHSNQNEKPETTANDPS